MRRAGVGLWLAAIVVGAALLRFAALDFGAGFEARPDERNVVMTLREMDAGRAITPLLVGYGGGYFYPTYVITRLAARRAGFPTLEAWIAADEHGATVVARAWSALLSTLTVALTFGAAWSLAGAEAGLVAAGALAGSTLAVREAHFAKADAAAAFFAALLVTALTRRWHRPDVRALALGAAAALTLSTKGCVGFLPAVALALAWPDGQHWPRPNLRALALGGVTLVALFLALNPFWITSFTTTLTWARAVIGSVSDTSYLAGGTAHVPGPLRYHADVSLRFGCGLVVAVLALPSLALGLMRGGAARWVAVAVLGYWAILAASPMVLARFFLPSVPALAVLTGVLVAEGVSWTGRSALRVPLALLGMSILVAEPLANSVTLVRLLSRADTRELAGAWVAAHATPLAPIVSWGAPPGAIDYGRPPLEGHPVLQRLAPERWGSSGASLLVHHHHPLPWSSDPLPPAGRSLRVLAVFDPFDGNVRRAVFEPLDAFYLPLAHFAGIARPGPRIVIAALEAAPAAPVRDGRR